MRRKTITSAILLAAAVSLAAWPSWAAGTRGDWPCVQRKVPTLSAGMMWAGPPISEDQADWRKDPEVSPLVERLAVRRTSIEEATRDIEAFAAGLDAAEKADKLTLVFSGVLQKANAERGDILDGIERFTRKQQKLADNIRAKRQELEKALEVANPTEADDEKRRALEEDLNWQTRIHEDRERSLTYVCEIPILLEQRLFTLARELANQIE
jgi:hypothetical protein